MPEEFFTDRRATDGRTSYCRPCMTVRNAESKARRARGERLTTRRPRRTVQSVTPFKTCPRCARTLPLEGFAINRANSRGISTYCLPCHSEVARADKIKNHGSTRNFHLKDRYGITEAEVAAMIEAQGGGCAICRVKPAEHVDHDHETGVVRGILCFTCNVGLGNFGDDRELLWLASHYIERHEKEQRMRLIMGRIA
ncbi:MAG: hypothetical protein QOE45_2488 [Frankiaceae bacterium]|jgi:hypothetical protein|nr:hypothetical protein [Frankiaceae bacterium]